MSADTMDRMLPHSPHGFSRLSLCTLLLLAGAGLLSAQEPEETPQPVPEDEEQTTGDPAEPVGEDADGAAPATPEASTEAEPPADPWLALAPYQVGYRDHAGVESLVADWVAGSGGRLRRVELPMTRGGRSVPAFEWGTFGVLPLEDRPTLILIGGLDGVSFAGGEAVLQAAAGLLHRTASLPEELTFIAIPWASPDGLQRTFEGASVSGVNYARSDEDGDEALDEDGPDDLDGDGLLLDMLIEDPEGEWTRASDPRFLARARPGDAPRYRLVREGADEDGDGLYNEDEVGGVQLDSNFPVSWETSGRGGGMGTWPLSEDVARALADLALNRRTACVLLFQGNHGSLACPGGVDEPGWDEEADRASWDWVARTLTKAHGKALFMPRKLREARGVARPGAAIDWLFAACGIPAMELALWGPQIALGPLEATPKPVPEMRDAKFREEALERPASAGPEPSAVDRAWARWLDNRRGGVGFTEWYPVGLGGGAQALLGGWAPRTRLNPPDDELARVLEGVDDFVEQLVLGLPKLEITLDESRRDGSILHLSARVANLGELATGMSTESEVARGETGVRLELTLPAGARILAGTEQVELGALAGGAKSRVVQWIVLAAPGSVVRLRATTAWALPSELEVRP